MSVKFCHSKETRLLCKNLPNCSNRFIGPAFSQLFKEKMGVFSVKKKNKNE